MRLVTVAGIAMGMAALALSPMHGQQSQSPTGTGSSQQALLNQYCLTCHNDRAKTGGLTLENLDVDRPVAQAEVWEKAIRKLRAGLMEFESTAMASSGLPTTQTTSSRNSHQTEKS